MNVIRWQTPWPMIQIAEHEWIVMRDDPRRPAALVRYLPDKPSARYRVVRWAPAPEDRRLFEYFLTLEQADMAVTFMELEPSTNTKPLTDERSPEWGRFERWFWSQAPELFALEAMPAWIHRQRMTRTPTTA